MRGAADGDLAGLRVGHQHLALHAVGIPEERAELATEVRDGAVGGPAAVSLERIRSKSSRLAACGPIWSSLPRPNIGVWWSAWRGPGRSGA